MRAGRLLLVCSLWLSVWPGLAQAQGPALPGRVEVAGGVRRIGPSRLGSSAANETTPDGGSSALFSTVTQLEPALAAEGRFGVSLTGSLQVEVSVSWGQSSLSTRITSDIEDLDDVTATEPVHQLAIDAGLVAHLMGLRLGSHATPFVSAGAGYLRDLHEDRTLVEAGRFYYVGGGLNVFFVERPAATMKAMGLRADARANLRTGGVAFDDDPVIMPAFSVSLFLRF